MERDGAYWVNLLAVDHVSAAPALNGEQEVHFYRCGNDPI